jgi:hypothetical protein
VSRCAEFAKAPSQQNGQRPGSAVPPTRTTTVKSNA